MSVQISPSFHSSGENDEFLSKSGSLLCHICSKECPVTMASPVQGMIKHPDHHGIHHGKIEFSKILYVLAE